MRDSNSNDVQNHSWSGYFVASYIESSGPDDTLHPSNEQKFEIPLMDLSISTSSPDSTFCFAHQDFLLDNSGSSSWAFPELEDSSRSRQGLSLDAEDIFGSLLSPSRPPNLFSNCLSIPDSRQGDLSSGPSMTIPYSPESTSSPYCLTSLLNIDSPFETSLDPDLDPNNFFSRSHEVRLDFQTQFTLSHERPIVRFGVSQAEGLHVFHPQTQDRTNRFKGPRDPKRRSRTIQGRETGGWKTSSSGKGPDGPSRKNRLFNRTRTHNKHKQREVVPAPASNTRDLSCAVITDLTVSPLQGLAHDYSVETPKTEKDLQSDQSRKTIQESEPSNKYKCTVLGCTKSFVNHHDLGRHKRTIHINQSAGEGYRCAVEGCSKSDKIWSRLDNFKTHLKMQHKLTDVDKIVQLSLRGAGDNATNAPFTVTTPESFSKSLQKRHPT